MTHPNESLSHLNGDAGVAQVGDNETRTFIEAVQLIEDAGWVVLRPEQVSRRAANRTGGVEVKSDMHRAASALLGTLWQTVYSGTQTFEENWVEMDRRFPQARWLQDELKAASLAAEAEPVAWQTEPSGLEVVTIEHDEFSLIEISKGYSRKNCVHLTIHRLSEESGRRDDLSIELTSSEASKVAAALSLTREGEKP